MENTNVTEQSTNEIMPMAASGETNFASLPEKTTPASGDMFLMEDSEDTKKINYDKLADAILNKLTSKTYSGLETTAKNFVTSINELNSKTRGFFKNISAIASIPDGEDLCQYLYDNYTEKSSIRIVGISSAITVSMGAPAAGGGFLIFYRPQTDNYGLVVCFSYTQAIHIKRLNNGWSDWKAIS